MKRLLVLLVGLLGASTGLISAPAPAPFEFKAINDQSLELLERGRPVFVYNFGLLHSTNTPHAQGHSSYIHPVYGLDGEILTDDFPKDHDYHRGLYWAWPHIQIGDNEYDSWSLRGISIQFRRWLTQQSGPSNAVLEVENAWVADGKEIMREQIRIEALPASSQARAIDLALTFVPTTEAVRLSGAPGKSYGGLTLRFAPRTITIVTVPNGRAAEDLLMARLPWADFSGDLNPSTGERSGAAIFVHPGHPDYPPTWMTRQYGVLAVGWPGVTPRTLTPGQRISCAYRIWIHRKELETAELKAAYDRYCAARP